MVNYDDDGEEEALSLCDLPTEGEENRSKHEEFAEKEIEKEDEDFNFDSWGGSVFTESDMCVADEVFFQGQLLPLRLSVSSRSESMDNRSFSGGYTSRSSSCKSYISSNSTNSTSTTTNYNVKYKFRNQFHTHPSPKPQIRNHGDGVGGGGGRKSSIWEIFRVGLLRTPEIELQNLKLRTKNYKSFGNRSNSTGSSSTNSDDVKMKKQSKKKQSFYEKDGSFFNGCKCSTDAIETVSSKIVILKGKNSEIEAMKEKLIQPKQGKHRDDQNRTFEWLKKLSIEGSSGGLDSS